MDWKKPFNLKNISGGKLVVGSIAVPHGRDRVVEPHRFPSEVLEALKTFASLGKIEVTNDFEVAEEGATFGSIAEPFLRSQYEQRDTRKNEKAISLGDADEINDGSIFKVTNNTDTISSAVQVEYTEVDRIEAREFLSQHWKRVESEVGKMTSTRKLKLYLEVANNSDIADKKIEIIEARLSELS